MENHKDSQKELEQIAKNTEKKTKIKVSPKDVEDIISAVKTTGNFWQIVNFSQKPIPVIAETIRLLKKYGYIDFENENIKVLEKLEKKFDYIPKFINELICPECQGRGINIKAIGIYEEFFEIQKNRPKPIQQYDQGNITPDSTIARVSMMRLRGDIAKKRIIVLGDDDLVGIALALTKLPEEILVLDIDKRLIDFTNEVAQSRGLKLKAEVFDLRNPLPKEFNRNFDVFVTDPPEAKKAFQTFLQKSIWCLKGVGSVGYIGMTLIDSSLHKWSELQKIILNSGAVITDIIRDFNKYENWDYHQNTLAWKIAPVKSPANTIWYVSAMVRIQIVRKPVAKNTLMKNKDIYIDTESTTT